jgi:hypothetical protein
MRKSIKFIIVVVFFILTAIGRTTTIANPDLSILSASDRQLVIEFRPQEWRTDTSLVNGEKRIHYFFKNGEYLTVPGESQRPSRTIVIGLPPEGGFTCSVLAADFKDDGRAPIAATPAMERDELATQFRYLSGANTAGEEQLVQAGEPFEFRKQRMVRLVFHPLQLDADGSIKRYQRIAVQIQFSPNGSAISLPVAQSSSQEKLFQTMLLNYEQSRAWRISRPATLAKTIRTTDGEEWYKIIIRGDGRGGLEGIYKIDAAALTRAGVPVATLDPRTIRIFNNGGRELPQNVATARSDSLIENAIQVTGEEDGRMDTGDYILFYGRSLEGIEYNTTERKFRHYINRFGYDNVYWLTFGGSTGKRITARKSQALSGTTEASFRDAVFLEEERSNIYKSGFDWLGFELANEKRTFSQIFSLPHAVVSDPATLRLQIAAATSGYHSFKVYANGNYLGKIELYGQGSAYLLKLGGFDATGALVAGDNAIRVDYESNSEITQSYIDWIELEYGRGFVASSDQLICNAPLRTSAVQYRIGTFSRDDIDVYDITDYNEVTRIVNGQIENRSLSFADAGDGSAPKRYIALTPAAYRAVTEIRKDEPGHLRQDRMVDYIIITHDLFYQQALKLESLHEDYDALDRLVTEVVRISDVFDEFSWGLVDPTAIRDFLVHAQKHWGAPGYVLLLGDGHFDYRNILKYNAANLIPPYESPDRIETSTRVVDDWFTYTLGSNYGMQLAIGRLPVQTVDEAQALVDKIIQYQTSFDPGEWRKTVALVGDDELGAGGRPDVVDHTRQSEWLAEHYVPSLLNVEKIYLMEYPAVRTASVSGITKPLANEALMARINEGCLVLNFIGHGNDELWTHERVLNAPTDFSRVQNDGRYALWVAATCEFAYWDQPQKQSLAERLLNATGRGAVAMVASSRLAYSGDNAAFNYSLFDYLFRFYESSGVTARLGDAVLLAKQMSSSSQINNEKFILLGDPAMRLGAPRHRATIEHISPTDTLQALTRVRVSGSMKKDQQPWSDFKGRLLLRVFDARKKRQYVTAEGIRVDYTLPGNTIFRGYAEGQQGAYQVEFIVPKDISYGGSDGRISLYFWDGVQEGSGYKSNLSVGGTAVNLVDHAGPDIRIHFGQDNFSPGDFAPQNSTLHVIIADSLSGVNIAGDIGHQIALTIDEGDAHNVTDYFQYDTGSYYHGELKYGLTHLTPGRHTLTVKAWDNSNNSSSQETFFNVVADSLLKIRNVLNYPNPFRATTRFTFEVSREAEVSIRIFSVAGRLLRSLPAMQAEVGFNVYPETWDGADAEGDLLANGVYLYRIQAKSRDNGKSLQTDEIGRVVIMR